MTTARMNLWDKIAAWYHRSVFSELFSHLSEDVFGVRLGSYENLALGANAENTLRNLILALMAGILLAAALSVYTKAVPGGFIRRLLRMGALSPDRAVTLYESGYFRSFGVRRDLKRGGALAKLVCRPDDDGRTLAGTTPLSDDDSTDADGRPSLVERLTADERPAAQAAAQPTVSDVPADATDADSSPSSEGSDDPTSDVAPAPLRPVDFYTDRFYIPESLRVRAEVRYDKEGSGVRNFLLTVVITVAAAVLLCRFLPSLLGLADVILGLF